MDVGDLVLKAQQMLNAFDDLSKDGQQLTMPKATVDSPTTTISEDGQTKTVTGKVSTGKDEADLNNQADMLLGSIYSLKENLKVWCEEKGVPFNGEKLINKNKNDVAIVHDLHNIRKHGKLNRHPRSGKMPKLKILGETVPKVEYGTTITLTIAEGGVSAAVADPDGSPARISLNARIFDKKGNELGDFIDICEQAIGKWSQELQTAGVKV